MNETEQCNETLEFKATKEVFHINDALTEEQNIVISTLTQAPDEAQEDEGSNFILIPLAVLFVIVILSAVVYLMARNRRRLAHIYCKRKNVTSFTYEEDSDSALEQGEGFDFDDPTECLLKGKLQIDNRYDSYQTTQVTQIANGRNEIYT